MQLNNFLPRASALIIPRNGSSALPIAHNSPSSLFNPHTFKCFPACTPMLGSCTWSHSWASTTKTTMPFSLVRPCPFLHGHTDHHPNGSPCALANAHQLFSPIPETEPRSHRDFLTHSLPCACTHRILQFHTEHPQQPARASDSLSQYCLELVALQARYFFPCPTRDARFEPA